MIPPETSSAETKGNGTSTTYRHNRDGAVTEITNLAPGGTINSQLTYTYGAVGQVATMTTGGVTTTYGYDADGELTSASSSGQARSFYAYDPRWQIGPQSPITGS